MSIMSALKDPFGTIGKSRGTPYRGILQAQSVQKHNLVPSPWNELPKLPPFIHIGKSYHQDCNIIFAAAPVIAGLTSCDKGR